MTRDDPVQPDSDIWSEWLLRGRHGGNAELDGRIRAETERIADRVIHGARLTSGMILADIGSGDGLVAFRAIDRIGRGLQAILTDISAPLLRHAEALARQRNVADQCRFHRCSADDLRAIGAASADAVTTRAVLAYVANKPAAFGEFFRILRPGGRLSIAEPIFWDEALAARALRDVIAARPPGYEERLMPLLHRWKSAQFPDTPDKIAASPMTNFTERDLIRFAQGAGFAGIHMEFHVDTTAAIITSWEAFLDSAPHPLAPPLGKILAEQFSENERDFFVPVVRAMAEASQFGGVSRIAYLSATKPAAPQPPKFAAGPGAVAPC